MHKFLLLLFLLTFKTLHLSAQHDKVYLYNHTKLIGKILSYQPKDSVQLQLSTGQIVTFYSKDVKNVVMEEVKHSKMYAFEERGFYNVSYFGVSFGKTRLPYNTQSSHLGVAFENITGFQLNRLLGIGLGLGIDNYYATDNDANVVSIFGEARGYLSRQNMSPYYSLSAGFGVPLVNTKDNLNLTDQRGGFMLHPAIGLRFGASSKINFFADIGTKFQHISFHQNNNWSENHYKITYQRWILRGGIMF